MSNIESFQNLIFYSPLPAIPRGDLLKPANTLIATARLSTASIAPLSVFEFPSTSAKYSPRLLTFCVRDCFFKNSSAFVPQPPLRPFRKCFVHMNNPDAVSARPPLFHFRKFFRQQSANVSLSATPLWTAIPFRAFTRRQRSHSDR